MKNKNCTKCKGKMKELSSKTPEGISYNYFKCNQCEEEIVDMKQLNKVAGKYREMKRFNAKLTKWGLSLGLRIPKELVKKYHLKDSKEVSMIPEKGAIKIIIS